MALLSEVTLHIAKSNQLKANRGMKRYVQPVYGRFSRKSGRFILDKTKIQMVVPPVHQARSADDADAATSDLRPYVSMSAKKWPAGPLAESYYIEKVIDEEPQRKESA